MRLTIKNLSPEQKAHLENAKASLQSLLKEAEDFFASLAQMRERFTGLQARRSQLDARAAEDSKAAAELAGLEIQLQHLGPDITKVERGCSAKLSRIGDQIADFRKFILAEFDNDLSGQLVSIVAKAIGPFFAPKVVPVVARSIVVETPAWLHLCSYLTQSVPTVDDLPSGSVLIADVVKEVDTILAGKPLLEMETPQDPPQIVEPEVNAHAPLISATEQRNRRLHQLAQENASALKTAPGSRGCCGPQGGFQLAHR